MKLSIVHTGKQHPENIVDKWSCIKIEGMYCIDIIFPSVASKEDIESITRLLGASSDLLQDLKYSIESLELIEKLQKQGNTVDVTDIVKRLKETINKAL
jgi:hypothetical protein